MVLILRVIISIITTLFNQQFSILNTDLLYIQIILKRIEEYDAKSNSLSLGLDIKSLVIFSRIYVESLLNLVTAFVIDGDEKLPWNKIGSFIQYLENHPPIDDTNIKKFWDSMQSEIRLTSSELNYRNFIAHSKSRGTEWTMSWPGHDNVSHASIVNAFGKGSGDKGSRKPRENILTIKRFTESIISFLKETCLTVNT